MVDGGKAKIKSLLYPMMAWADRHFGFLEHCWSMKSGKQIEEYFGTIGDDADRYIAGVLEAIQFENFLELGCGCGNRLFNIAKLYPQIKITGIDVSSRAIKIGNDFFKSSGIENVEFVQKRIESLEDFPSDSFDVIFSRATLIYISPKKIVPVLKEIVRVAKKHVILMEMQGEDLKNDPRGTGIFCPPGNWKRDYVRLLGDLGIEKECIRVEEVSTSVWSPGGGGATLIMFEKKKGF
ncbi:MAG TPA: class I SAM-dependent methyltransferase [Candidatus Omnitrophota bacterium]|nr:class I SAM-dependent methyltransferase [Candidatus Omnitrophota bacterium]HSA30242.1 class I SAM-dependent methyltransferase [Candidatus Omnitrophota bacterium]